MDGSEAEWIMERPTVHSNNGTSSLPDLADYGSVTMSYVAARRTDNRYVEYQGDINLQITMVNGSDIGLLRLGTHTPSPCPVSSLRPYDSGALALLSPGSRGIGLPTMWPWDPPR